MADTVQYNPSTGKVNVKDESHASASTAFALGAGMGGIGGGAAGLPSTGTFVPIGAAAFAGVAMPFNASELVKVQMVGPPEYAEHDCEECFDANQTPLYYTIEISGVIDCGCGGGVPDATSINGIWKLTNMGPSEPCQFEYLDDDFQIQLRIRDHINPALVCFASCRQDGSYYSAYKYTDTVGVGCLNEESDMPNDNLIGHCCGGAPKVIGYDGVASWCPGWHSGGCS